MSRNAMISVFFPFLVFRNFWDTLLDD